MVRSIRGAEIGGARNDGHSSAARAGPWGNAADNAQGTSNQELTYFVAWDSLADREKKWTAFQSDPDWIAGRAKSEEDGQIIDNIVSQLLVPTAFSSVK